MSEPKTETTHAGDDLTVNEFCQLMARRFGIGPSSGEQTIELHFKNGNYRWARKHSGPIGQDDLGKMGESTA
jgi:hypothetical protein